MTEDDLMEMLRNGTARIVPRSLFSENFIVEQNNYLKFFRENHLQTLSDFDTLRTYSASVVVAHGYWTRMHVDLFDPYILVENGIHEPALAFLRDVACADDPTLACAGEVLFLSIWAAQEQYRDLKPGVEAIWNEIARGRRCMFDGMVFMSPKGFLDRRFWIDDIASLAARFPIDP